MSDLGSCATEDNTYIHHDMLHYVATSVLNLHLSYGTVTNVTSIPTTVYARFEDPSPNDVTLCLYDN
jgi:hypothetical protein